MHVIEEVPCENRLGWRSNAVRDSTSNVHGMAKTNNSDTPSLSRYASLNANICCLETRLPRTQRNSRISVGEQTRRRHILREQCRTPEAELTQEIGENIPYAERHITKIYDDGVKGV